MRCKTRIINYGKNGRDQGLYDLAFFIKVGKKRENIAVRYSHYDEEQFDIHTPGTYSIHQFNQEQLHAAEIDKNSMLVGAKDKDGQLYWFAPLDFELEHSKIPTDDGYNKIFKPYIVVYTGMNEHNLPLFGKLYLECISIIYFFGVECGALTHAFDGSIPLELPLKKSNL